MFLVGITGEDLAPNGNFENRDRGWRGYSNFVKGEEVKDWQLEIDKGRAVIIGRDSQPQSRVGFRSVPIPLEQEISSGKTGVYRLSISWRGKDIHRSGAYYILTGDNGLFRQGEIKGPAGAFSEKQTAFFPLTRLDVLNDPSLLIYIFHDGQGVLEVKEISLSLFGTGTENLEKRDIRMKLIPIPEREDIARGIVVQDNDDLEQNFGSFFDYNSNANLLPGELRFLPASASRKGINIRCGFHIEPRTTAFSWVHGVAKDIPFWLNPVKQIDDADVILAEGKDSDTPPLPELPSNRGVYLYYYGDFRYGGTEEDLEHDRKELKLIRDAGFTGLCVQDDYGMDYGEWKKSGKIDPGFLLKIAELYRNTDFPSPPVFGLFTGIDKGRIMWKGSEKDMRRYLSSVNSSLKEVEKILGKANLWVAPVDEPNDEERFEYVRDILPLWREHLDFPVMITCNWKTAGRINGPENLWLGAGDYPSFEKAETRGANGFYRSIDSHISPLRFRYLAGVHSWASGMPNQAYWHYMDISGNAQSDLDGIKADFLCVHPESDLTTPVLSMPFVELREGIMDLRLLCALEENSKAPENPASKKIREFLREIRNSVLPTEREYPPWNDPEAFEDLRTRGIFLWREFHKKSKTSPR